MRVVLRVVLILLFVLSASLWGQQYQLGTGQSYANGYAWDGFGGEQDDDFAEFEAYVHCEASNNHAIADAFLAIGFFNACAAEVDHREITQGGECWCYADQSALWAWDSVFRPEYTFKAWANTAQEVLEEGEDLNDWLSGESHAGTFSFFWYADRTGMHWYLTQDGAYYAGGDNPWYDVSTTGRVCEVTCWVLEPVTPDFVYTSAAVDAASTDGYPHAKRYGNAKTEVFLY